MQGASAGLIVDFKHLVAQFLFQAAKLDGGGGALLSALALNLLHFGQGVDERGVRYPQRRARLPSPFRWCPS